MALTTPTWATTLVVEIPKAITDRKTKIKIKNKKTNQEKSYPGNTKKLVLKAPELLGLGFKNLDTLASHLEIYFWENAAYRTKVGQQLGPGTKSLQSSLVFDRPFWRSTGFKRKISNKLFVATIHSILPVEMSNPAAKGSLTASDSQKKLFQIGWKSYKAKRYDLGLLAFEKLLDPKRALSAEAQSEAYLGRAIGNFHQKGCSAAEVDFISASRDPKQKDDTNYYKGLCLVEAKEYEKAGVLFQALLDKNHEKFAEPSRLYLGVVAEALEKFDIAEAAYLDTKDFADDPGLIKIADDRLKMLKAKKEAAKASSLFVGAFSLSLGYDTNVINLPQELSASAMSVSNEKSALMMTNTLLSLNPKLSSKWTSSLVYTGVVLHHFSKELADRNDVQSHDISANVFYQRNAFDKYGLGISWSTVFLGTLSDFNEYIRIPSANFTWQHISGTAEAPTGMWNYQLKFSQVQPQTTPASTDVDQTANGYFFSVKYSFLNHQPHVFGPVSEIEYKPATGRENSYYSAAAGAHWGVPVGPDSWGLYTQNDFMAKYSNYYETRLDRKDYFLQYNGSLAKTLGERFEAKIQATQTFNFSTNKSSYQYDKTLATFVIGAVF